MGRAGKLALDVIQLRLQTVDAGPRFLIQRRMHLLFALLVDFFDFGFQARPRLGVGRRGSQRAHFFVQRFSLGVSFLNFGVGGFSGDIQQRLNLGGERALAG